MKSHSIYVSYLGDSASEAIETVKLSPQNAMSTIIHRSLS